MYETVGWHVHRKKILLLRMMLSVLFITYLSFYLFWLTKSIFGLLTKFTKFVPLLITWWWVFSIYLVRSDVFLSQMITDDGQILVLIIIKLLTSSSDLSAICQNLSQFIIHPTDLSVFEKLQRRKIYHGLVLVAVQIPKMCSRARNEGSRRFHNPREDSY